MKIYAKDLYKRGVAPFKKVLLFGPDEAAIQYAENTILKLLQTSKEFENAATLKIEFKEIRATPNLLLTQLKERDLFGTKKIVLVTGIFGNLAKGFLELVQNLLPSGALILVAGDLKPNSQLRILGEKAKDILTIACYQDEPKDLNVFVADLLRKENIDFENLVPQAIVEYLPNSRLLLEKEIEKIALFLNKEKLCYEILETILSDLSYVNIDEMFYYIVSNQPDNMINLLAKAPDLDITFIMIVRALLRQFAKLEEILEKVSKGETIQSAIEKLSPPLFFKVKPMYLKAAALIDLTNVRKCIKKLCQLELLCKTKGLDQYLLLTHSIMEIMYETSTSKLENKATA